MPAILSSLSPTAADPLSRPLRIAAAASMVALHALAIWALLQLGPVRQAVGAAVPIFVDLIVPPAPEPPKGALTPPPPPPETVSPPMRRPVIARKPKPTPVEPVLTAPPPRPEPTRAAEPEPAPAPADPAPVAPPAQPAPQAEPAVAAAPPPAPVPRAPREVSIRAVEYLTLPVLHYPLASRRLQEEGRVHVRVLVDVAGLPREMQVIRSTGYPRLDEAALAAVRATRFKPYTGNGVAMPFWVVMPLVFELEN